MLNGLDLFSGGGGAELALAPWVRAVAYCESDESAQEVLLERQQSGEIPIAPIWDDIRTLEGRHIPVPVDAIYGGWPCTEISIAGSRKGLVGKQSGLIWDVLRLVGEFRPAIVFLENSPNIVHLGLERILGALHVLGYDARWTVVSAEEVGAPHLRERLWLLAYSDGNRIRLESESERRSDGRTVGRSPRAEDSYAQGVGWRERWTEPSDEGRADASGVGSEDRDPLREGRQRWLDAREAWQTLALGGGGGGGSWPSWLPQPCVGRGHHGLPSRMDRIKIMGNAWVPAQAREAFQRLRSYDDANA